ATQEIFSLEQMADLFSFERVNKAGAKFDWDKLNWINSQYLHDMTSENLTALLIPYWQAANFAFDADADRPWLDQISALIGPSLVTLKDCIGQCEYLFSDNIAIADDAKAFLGQDGVADALGGILEHTESGDDFTIELAQSAIKQVVKAQGVKKGLVMRSIRAALTGALNGPDLMQSWLLLNRRGVDRARLRNAQELS
ncbi:MAG: glutamate--tRNA ligase, partial [Cyanobacteria bacterium P01_F01_bin.42]